MPRIPDSWMESVIYLYPSRKAAENGEGYGGSGFMVGVRSSAFKNAWFGYAVTNKHVVEDAKSRTIRVNTQDGKTDIIETDIGHWTRSGTDDLAVMNLPLDPAHHKFWFVPEEAFVTPEVIKDYHIGFGDEICLAGRFISHEGKQSNNPAARFGNIAMMPGEPVRRKDGSLQESFLVDMRSIPGYSGSPAFLYILPSEFMNRKLDYGRVQRAHGPWLLGVDWGHLSEWKPVLEADQKTHHPSKLGVNLNTGMAGIVPAWRLRELLYGEELKMQRQQADEDFAAQGTPGELDAEIEQGFTKEDFEAALKKVSKKIKPSRSDEEK
jgi:hypothetical protein